MARIAKLWLSQNKTLLGGVLARNLVNAKCFVILQDHLHKSVTKRPTLFMDMDRRGKAPPVLMYRTRFPYKLHMLLDEQTSCGGPISWVQNGSAFRVNDRLAFASSVLKRHFATQSSFKSFQRQLNLWGFQRIKKGTSKGGYYHPWFSRTSSPELCRFMVRSATACKKARIGKQDSSLSITEGERGVVGDIDVDFEEADSARLGGREGTADGTDADSCTGGAKKPVGNEDESSLLGDTAGNCPHSRHEDGCRPQEGGVPQSVTIPSAGARISIRNRHQNHSSLTTMTLCSHTTSLDEASNDGFNKILSSAVSLFVDDGGWMRHARNMITADQTTSSAGRRWSLSTTSNSWKPNDSKEMENTDPPVSVHPFPRREETKNVRECQALSEGHQASGSKVSPFEEKISVLKKAKLASAVSEDEEKVAETMAPDDQSGPDFFDIDSVFV